MRSLLTASLLVVLASPALGANWVVDATQSSLVFEASQAGQSTEGKFTRFTPAIDFDEATPEKGHITVTVDIASVTSDSKEAAEALPTSDWFGASQFPQASFTSTTIHKTGDHQFAAEGNLTLHGITRPITLPFILAAQGSKTRAVGQTTLNRQDFGIGQGRWADDKWIGFPVIVHYSILATPQ
jgi:polyisoprenoid-binding protein YceI